MYQETTKSRAGEIIRGLVPDGPYMQMIKVEAGDLDSRIGFMIDEIEQGIQDVDIQNLTSKILKSYNVKNRDWTGQAQAVFEWVRDNIRYVRDPAGLEQFRKPIRTVQQGMGDCDDMTILICSLLGTIGLNCIIRVIGVSSDEPEHVYPLVLVPPVNPTGAIALDATRPEPMGFEVHKNKIKFLQDYDPNLEE